MEECGKIENIIKNDIARILGKSSKKKKRIRKIDIKKIDRKKKKIRKVSK